jgi:hypothetical protein
MPCPRMTDPRNGRALDRTRMAEAAEAVRRLLAKLDAGELTAGALAEGHLRGALAALDSLLEDLPADRE